MEKTWHFIINNQWLSYKSVAPCQSIIVVVQTYIFTQLLFSAIWFLFPRYIKIFGCDISEAEVEDLKYYRNLGEFFRRSLKNGVRPIDSLSPIVSCGFETVLHFIKLELSNEWMTFLTGFTR